jgi:hypothetical protein
MYPAFKQSVLGQRLTSVQGITDPYGAQCVVLGWAYANALFPTVPISKSISTGNAKDVFANASSTYFTKVTNNPNDPSQLPPQGAILVIGTSINPEGHEGIIDSCNEETYTILNQNSPIGSGVDLSTFKWTQFLPEGWLIPAVTTSNPTPAPAPSGHTLHLLPSVSVWHVYNVGGPYIPSAAIHVLDPAAFGGLSYQIEATLAPNVYEITTQDFGNVAIYANPAVDACVIS